MGRGYKTSLSDLVNNGKVKKAVKFIYEKSIKLNDKYSKDVIHALVKCIFCLEEEQLCILKLLSKGNWAKCINLKLTAINNTEWLRQVNVFVRADVTRTKWKNIMDKIKENYDDSGNEFSIPCINPYNLKRGREQNVNVPNKKRRINKKPTKKRSKKEKSDTPISDSEEDDNNTKNNNQNPNTKNNNKNPKANNNNKNPNTKNNNKNPNANNNNNNNNNNNGPYIGDEDNDIDMNDYDNDSTDLDMQSDIEILEDENIKPKRKQKQQQQDIHDKNQQELTKRKQFIGNNDDPDTDSDAETTMDDNLNTNKGLQLFYNNINYELSNKQVLTLVKAGVKKYKNKKSFINYVEALNNSIKFGFMDIEDEEEEKEKETSKIGKVKKKKKKKIKKIKKESKNNNNNNYETDDEDEDDDDYFNKDSDPCTRKWCQTLNNKGISSIIKSHAWAWNQIYNNNCATNLVSFRFCDLYHSRKFITYINRKYIIPLRNKGRNITYKYMIAILLISVDTIPTTMEDIEKDENIQRILEDPDRSLREYNHLLNSLKEINLNEKDLKWRDVKFP